MCHVRMGGGVCLFNKLQFTLIYFDLDLVQRLSHSTFRHCRNFQTFIFDSLLHVNHDPDLQNFHLVLYIEKK